MKRWFKEQDILTCLLAAMVAGEFLLLVYYNLTADFIYDQDASKVLYRAVKMWENGSLVLPNWTYETTGEWDCVAFPAMFLYGMTGNIIRSFAIANILDILLFMLVVYVLLGSVGVRNRNILFALSILLIPYGWGMLEYTNMLFFSAAQYIYKVMAPLCLLAVFHYRDRYRGRVGYYALLIFMLLLLFLTATSSGLYVAACGLFAIYITRILHFLIHKERPERRNVVVFGLSLLVVLGAYYLHVHWGINSSADSMQLYALTALPDNLRNLILGFFDIFKINPENCSLFSREGFSSIVRIPLVLFLVIYGFSNIKKTLRLDELTGFASGAESAQDLIEAELISITMVNGLIILLTIPTFENRYQLIGVIPLILLAIITFDRKVNGQLLAGILFVILCVINVFAQYNAYIVVHNTPEGFYSKELCMRILDEAYEENVDAVVVYYRTELSETLRGYDSDMEVITYQSADNRFMDYDVAYGEKPISYIDDKECLIVMEGGFDMENTQDFIKAGYHYKDNIEDYSILVPNR